MAVVIKEPIEFIWDKGNKDKSWLKHEVTNSESEEIFFDANKRISKDKFHSVVFTIRDKKVRIISARDINRKEKQLYTT